MQHRMMKDAQKAMAPWLHGQPLYAPMGSQGSSQMNPLLYAGTEYSGKQNIPMGAMPLPPPQPGYQPGYPPGMAPSFHGNEMPPSMHGGSAQGTHHALDYLESQVRGMEMGTPLLQQAPPPQHIPPPPQHMPQGVPFSAGPPSMLSSLNEMGVQGVERRVIQLPPIVERPGSNPRNGPGPRGPRPPSNSSGSSARPGGRRPGPRDLSPPRRGILRSYGEDSDFEDRRRGPGPGPGRVRSRSRDDILGDLHRAAPRRDRSYSPPRRRGSWSSDEGSSRRGGGGGGGGARGRGDPWPEKPPSYNSIDVHPGRRPNNARNGGARNNERYSVRLLY